MHKQKRGRKLAIFGLLLFLMVISVGYAAFQTQLNVKGNASITSVWNVEVTSITTKSIIGSAENVGLPTYDKLSANMEANFYESGDAIVYEITVLNSGTIDAVLDSINVDTSDYGILTFELGGLAKGDKLLASQSKTFTFTVTYPAALVTQTSEMGITAEIQLNYVQSGTEK